jgi:hypothetical protein
MTRAAQLPPGFKAVGVFLLFGFVMACLAGTTLFWRGTPLDRMWALNLRAYNQLAPHGRVVGILSFCWASLSLRLEPDGAGVVAGGGD